MKISTSKFYSYLLLLVIFLQLYLPSFKLNVIIQLIVLVFIALTNNFILTKKFIKEIIPLVILFFIGFLGLFLFQNKLYNTFKDLSHFIKPLSGIFVGYLLARKINDFSVFIRGIVFLGVFSASIHFVTILMISGLDTVSQIREFGKDNFLELFALFFLIYYERFQHKKLFSNKLNHYIVVVVLALSCLLYLSRTMIVVAVILLFSIYNFTKITKKTIQLFVTLCIAVVLFYSYLFSVKIDRNGAGIESFLYKVKIAPEEIFTTKIDRENHKDLWDHWRGYEAKRAFVLMEKNPSSYVFGTGYGSLVNLKFYAPLSGDKKGMKYISELHNGYIYLLYKTGIIGLFIYFFFLYRLYKRAYETSTFYTVIISAFGIIYVFSTLTITGTYNARDIIIILLGAFLFYDSKNALNNE
ncbi:O-antigen ligase family protein [Flavobacterium sp.]|uniref:O-antigen ligase family protein n=1 Tax=Flavobacterium sp. TaxID=239 RepID=UPI001B67A7AA|nr:O-antigen ligase family protein [Flavobacterium sp.]MBP6183007.1 O-antigen ligase family protein [Flavobacterium sp.]